MSAVLNSFDDVSKESAEPIYRQIKTIIEQKINQGEWVAGQKLPSENELVNLLQVSRMTINRSLRELTQAGIIKRVHGLGSYVAEKPRHASLIELQDIAIEVEQSGGRYHAEVLNLEKLSTDSSMSDNLELRQGDPVYYLESVHYQDDIPIQLEQRYVNSRKVPEFINQDFCAITSTAYLLQQFHPDEMEHRVRAILADSHTNDVLRLESNQPCLQLTRRTWKRNQLVTCVTLTYPGDRYDLTARYATDYYRKTAHNPYGK
ncbi:MAG: GntR family histidine utilization transcriptional repressor [Gammaproteobacteria bacterium]|jgi:GntR family histidine utilization transcriptional repressor